MRPTPAPTVEGGRNDRSQMWWMVEGEHVHGNALVLRVRGGKQPELEQAAYLHV
jgi:hypothetical protein